MVTRKENILSVIGICLMLVLVGLFVFAGTFGTTLTTAMYPPAVGITLQDTYSLSELNSQKLYAVNNIGGWRVPSTYNNWYITSASVYAYTVSSSGLPTFQVTNTCRNVYLFDTLLTVDATEHDSKDATTAATIYSASKVIYSGDYIRWDCSVAGTDTAGCTLQLNVQPNP